MNTITKKYLYKYMEFKGTYVEFVRTIPESDKRKINWNTLNKEAKRIELRRGR